MPLPMKLKTLITSRFKWYIFDSNSSKSSINQGETAHKERSTDFLKNQNDTAVDSISSHSFCACTYPDRSLSHKLLFQESLNNEISKALRLRSPGVIFLSCSIPLHLTSFLTHMSLPYLFLLLFLCLFEDG